MSWSELPGSSAVNKTPPIVVMPGSSRLLWACPLPTLPQPQRPPCHLRPSPPAPLPRPSQAGEDFPHLFTPDHWGLLVCFCFSKGLVSW